MKLPINKKHFASICEEHEQGKHWLEVPLFKWVDKNIGAMNLNLNGSQILHGKGWHFGSNLHEIMLKKNSDLDKDLTYFIEIEIPIEEHIITEFLLRWG